MGELLRRLCLALALPLAIWPASATEDIAVLSAFVQPKGNENIVVLSVANRRQVDVDIVAVEIGSRKGVLELQRKSVWTRVEKLRLPGHTELRMDPEHGPRVRLLPGAILPQSGSVAIILSTGDRIMVPYTVRSEDGMHGS